VLINQMSNRKNNVSENKGNITLVIILIVAIVVAAIVIVWSLKGSGRIKQEQLPAPVSVPVDEQVKNLQKMSTSDDIGAIEADLNSTNLDNLDSEISEIDNSSGDL